MSLNLNPLHNLQTIAGTAFSDPGKAAEAKRKNELLQYLAMMQGNLNDTLPLQEKYLKEGLAADQEGYQSGLDDVTRSEAAGTEQIETAGAAGLKASQAQAAQLGITGGSGGTNMVRASAGDTRRALSDFQMGIARQRSSLKIAAGQSKAAGLGQLANFEAYKASAKNNVLQPYFNWLGSINYQHQPLALAGLGTAAGFFGGGGGPGNSVQPPATQQPAAGAPTGYPEGGIF